MSATGETVQLRLEDDSASVTAYRIGGAGGGEIVIDGEARRWTSL